MSGAALFFRLVRWDIIRELRRKETLVNMVLFAVLILFLIHQSIGPLLDAVRTDPRAQSVGRAVAPVFFWITVLFAGTVGLSRSFAAEREGDSLTGVVLAPIDLGLFYLAKVTATWVYVLLMEVALVGAYTILFDFNDWEVLPSLLLVLAVFSLGYIAAGVTLAAMTTALKGKGEVILRILLFPVMIPLVYLTLRVPQATFGADVTGGMSRPVELSHYVATALAIDAIYLAAGFLLFPKVLEE